MATPNEPKLLSFGGAGIVYQVTKDCGEAAESRGTFGYHGQKVVSLPQERKFPDMDENDIDTMIRKCWYGEYGSIKSLKFEVIRWIAGSNSVWRKPCERRNMRQDVRNASNW